MASDNGKPRLDLLAERLEAKLQAVRQIQRILADHPELASEIVSTDSAPAHPELGLSTADDGGRRSPLPKHRATGRRQQSQAERVAEYLLQHDNQPHTVLEIQRGAGIPRNSVNYVLYTSRPSHFEKVKEEGDSMKWRVSAEGLLVYGPMVQG
jgi:hypothetical protein